MTKSLLTVTLIALVWVVVAWVLSYRYVAAVSFTATNARGEHATRLESDAGRIAWIREQTRVVAAEPYETTPDWHVTRSTESSRGALRLNELAPPGIPHWGVTGFGDSRTEGWAVRYHVLVLALALVVLACIWRLLTRSAGTAVSPVAANASDQAADLDQSDSHP